MSLADYLRKRSAELRATPIANLPVTLAGMPSAGTAIPAILASAALRFQKGDTGAPPHPALEGETKSGGVSGGGGASGTTNPGAPPVAPDESTTVPKVDVSDDDASKTYTVKAGDTLSGIASTLYGDPARYLDLAKQNQIKNPNFIRAGQVLKLPSSSRRFRR